MPTSRGSPNGTFAPSWLTFAVKRWKLRRSVLTVTGQATNEVDWYRKIFHSTNYSNHDATLHNFCGDYYVM